MASEVKADKLSPSAGTTVTLGDASDTITIPTGATLNVVDGVGVASGGTGLASFTAGDILYATGSTTLAKLAKGTAEQILSINSGATAPEWTTAAATAGGTGQTSFTAGDILYANSTTTLTKLGKGTGLQGLQTNSGATAPQWANSPQSLMTAAGDILYASGANTLAKLAKGSDDEILTLASGIPSWAAAASGGKIGQVLSDIGTAKISTTSTTQVTTGIAVTITPVATSSKIWLTANIGTLGQNTYPARTFFTIVGGNAATYIGDAADSAHRVSSCNCVDRADYAQVGSQINYLDSPSTTSATTYTLFYWSDIGTTYLNSSSTTGGSSGNAASSLTAMDVLA